MYIYICIYVYIYMYICICIYIYICIYVYVYIYICICIYIYLMNLFHYVYDPSMIVLSDISLTNFRFPWQVTRSWLWSASMHGRRTLLCCGGSWRRKNGGSFKGFNGFQWVLTGFNFQCQLGFINMFHICCIEIEINWIQLALKKIWHAS